MRIAYYCFTLAPPPGKNTREVLRRSSLFSMVEQLKTSRNSIEVTQLAETSFNNLKVSIVLFHTY